MNLRSKKWPWLSEGWEYTEAPTFLRLGDMGKMRKPRKCKKPTPPEILEWRDEFLKDDRICKFPCWLAWILWTVAILINIGVLIWLLCQTTYLPPIS